MWFKVSGSTGSRCSLRVLVLWGLVGYWFWMWCKCSDSTGSRCGLLRVLVLCAQVRSEGSSCMGSKCGVRVLFLWGLDMVWGFWFYRV